MKKTFLIFTVSVVLSLLFLQAVVPIDVLAQGSTQNPGSLGGSTQNPGNQGGSTQNPGLIGIQNPVNADSISDLIHQVLNFVASLLAIAGGLYIIWSGFMLVKARGNPAEIEKAKKSFVNAIIGMAIILGAVAISYVIKGTIDNITSNTSGSSQ